MRNIHRLILLLIATCAAPALAQLQLPDICPVTSEDPWTDQQLADWTQGLPLPPPGEVAIRADRVDLSNLQDSLFIGGVQVAYGTQRLASEQLRIDRVNDVAIADGRARFRDESLDLQANRIEMNMAQETAIVEEAEYQLLEGNGRGTAARAERRGDSVTDLQEVEFTTCPRGVNDWTLSAARMELDHASGSGRARNMTLRFKGFPLLKLPKASFPLDDRRKSGFLVPSFGRSDDDGLDLAIPYYLNLSPSRDATMTPRLISDRGAMLMSEYRYLGASFQGELGFEYLPNDDITRDHRSFAWLRHRGEPATRWLLDLNVSHISDDQYFEDLSDSLAATSRSFLRSSAQLSTYGEQWEAALLLDAFESIDDTISEFAEPYERLPRLTFGWNRPRSAGGWAINLDSELVAFDRDVGDTGVRLDLFPQINWSLNRPGYTLRPGLGLRYTAYDLDRPIDDSPSRTTPIADLEGRFFFERRKGNWLQTLEPRFYYLYVPFEDQTGLPQFDTREFTFSFGQLFRNNRFTGADRQNDANQLTLALTSRLIDQDRGHQVLDVSVGTVVYFRDQRVQLPGSALLDADTSALVTEINYRPSKTWRVRFGFQYEPEEQKLQQAILGFQHRGEQGRIVNFAYRRRSDQVDQVDISVMAPLAQRWNIVARANYSFLDDTLLEGLAGFEYNSCCWALRFFGRRYVRSQDGDKRNGLYLELELRGLGALGRDTGRILERAILGYRREDD